MSNLDDMLSQLNQTKPKSVLQDLAEKAAEAAITEEDTKIKVAAVKAVVIPAKVEVKKEVKKRKRKKDAKQDDNDILPPMLKPVPSRRRVHCGICKKMLNSNEQGWFLQVNDLEYWWCSKCTKD